MRRHEHQAIYGGSIIGAKIRAESARKRAAEAARKADRAEAEAWSIQMEGYGGPAQPSPTIGQCLNGGLGWLEVECNRSNTRASLPLDAIRRPRDTPWCATRARGEIVMKVLACCYGRVLAVCCIRNMPSLPWWGWPKPKNRCLRTHQIPRR
jgi:hypothetical protein